VIEGAFVACQRYRGMIGDSENLYDAAAAVLINQELGAEVRYADGRPFDIAAQAQGRRIAGTWIIFPPDTGFSLKG
jgi:fructose-1,6-bisphosphatase/inositol monophosphatase family enzyme